MPSPILTSSLELELGRKVEELRRELDEAHRRETATAAVLRVISRSRSEAKPVFDIIAASALRLVNAQSVIVVLYDGEVLHLAALENRNPEGAEALRGSFPRRADSSLSSGRAVQFRRTVQIPDVLDDPAYELELKNAGYRSLLSVPMLRNNEPIGAIAVGRDQPGLFSEKHVELFQTFADQAVIAIENTRLFGEVQARTRQLTESLEYQTATSEVLNVISRSPSQLQPVLDSIVATAADLCQADFAMIHTLEHDRFRLVAANKVGADYIKWLAQNPPTTGRGSVSGRAVAERATIHIPDVLADPEYAQTRSESLKRGHQRTTLGVPLLREGVPIGVIALHRTEVRPFDDKQIELVTTFADQAVIAIENARLFGELQARTRELAESLEYQTATSEVLQVISRSQADLKPVYETMLAKAMLHCEAHIGVLHRYDGREFHSVAESGIPPAYVQHIRTTPQVAGPDTALGQMLATKQPVHVHDVRDSDAYRKGDPMRRATVDLGGARTLLTVPLIKDGEVIGDFAFYRKEVRPFSDKQIELVKNFASQAVIAIENTRLFEEVQSRTRELTASLEYQTATSDVLGVISRSPTDVQPVFDTIAQAAAQLCKAQFCHVFRFDGHLIHFAASHRQPQPSIDTMRRIYPIPPGRVSAAARSILTGTVEEIPDIHADPEYEHGDTANYRSIVAVPMLKDGGPVGAICMARTETGRFPERQVDLLRTFADQAVIAIENTRLFEAEQGSKRELQESLDQQTATNEILGVISRSPTDVQPVFDAIVESGRKLFAGAAISVALPDGDQVRAVAVAATDAGLAQALRNRFPFPLTREYMHGLAVLDGRVVDIPDVRDAPAEFAAGARNFLASGYRAVTMMPMMRSGAAIGVISVVRLEPGSLSDKQVELLKTFADQAVIAIENTRLFAEVQTRTGELSRSVQELRALGEVARAVSSSLDLKVVLKTIVERAVALSGTDGGSIFYYRPEVGRFELGETTGLDEDVVAKFRKLDIAARGTGQGEAIANRQPLQISDLAKRPNNPLRDAAIEAGLRAAVTIPLLGSEGPLGTLVVWRREPSEFSDAVVSLMQSFADQSAIALENARLFNEIAQKSRELEIASQHKSQFVANMSHELRTPLAAILGYAELMQEGFYEPQGPKSLDALTRIRSNGKHLLGLINTVLDIAKIESGQFNLNLGEYALDSVVETVRAATEALAETKKLILKTEVAKALPIGLGDEQRLTQVLLNLVGNAIKFTDTGEVRIAARAVNGHFAVSVADTGPGIPQEHQARIFEQFHQVDSSNTKAKGGTGLGLAIAKQIVDMHGGRIWVESTIGKGSTFRMEIPTRAATT